MFFSVWDDDTVIQSFCKYDEETNTALDIEQIDVDGMDINVLTDEFVLLEDGTEIRDFLLDE